MSESHTDKDTVHFCYYIVAVIDVLGQGEKLGAMTSIPETAEQKAKFIALLKDTFGRIEELRGMFKKFFEVYRRREHLPGEDAKRLLAAKVLPPPEPVDLKLGQVFFSDMFMFFAPIHKIEDHLSVQEVYAMLTACATIMRFSLAGKCRARGY